MRQNPPNQLHPSIRAASSISRGVARIKLVYKKILNGRQDAVLSRIIPQYVLIAPKLRIRMYSGTVLMMLGTAMLNRNRP